MPDKILGKFGDYDSVNLALSRVYDLPEEWSVSVIIPGDPVPQPRWKKYGKDHAIHAYRQSVALYTRLVLPKSIQFPCDGLFRVDVRFDIARPKNMIWSRKPMPAEPCRTIMDVDNLIKGLKDSLNNVVWTDDRLVFCDRGSKWYHAGDGSPCTYLRVTKIKE